MIVKERKSGREKVRTEREKKRQGERELQSAQC